jgi:hypothetical protein
VEELSWKVTLGSQNKVYARVELRTVKPTPGWVIIVTPFKPLVEI